MKNLINRGNVMDKKLMKLFLECPNYVREVVITDHQIGLINEIQDWGEADARELADHKNCSIQNASSQLKRLWEKKYLTREEVVSKSGGVEYRYRCAIEFTQ